MRFAISLILGIFAAKTHMNIESIISNFEHQLKNIGFSEKNGAMLIQVNIDGNNYIKSVGNLNNFTSPVSTTIIKENEIAHVLVDFVEKEIKAAPVADTTKKLHYDTLKLLKEYNSTIFIEKVNTAFLIDLESYLVAKKLAINTIARHMKVLKRYINVARKKELITKYPFFGYSIRSEQTHREALTEKELELLEHYRAQLHEPDEILNAFLFSCYTGLRYSDIKTLTKQDIQNYNSSRWILTRMKKTNHEIRIPIKTIFNGKALEISKAIPRSRGVLFKLKNNQQTNRHLKRIAKVLGIKKKISFHTARHTCATLLLYRGVSITSVQRILGHQSVKTTQIYSTVTDLTLQKELRKSNKKEYK